MSAPVAWPTLYITSTRSIGVDIVPAQAVASEGSLELHVCQDLAWPTCAGWLIVSSVRVDTPASSTQPRDL